MEGSCIAALEPMAEKDRLKMAGALTRHAKRFHQQLLKPTHPAPSILQLMAFRISRTSMKLTLGDHNRDYTYYRDHGWFNSDYY